MSIGIGIGSLLSREGRNLWTHAHIAFTPAATPITDLSPIGTVVGTLSVAGQSLLSVGGSAVMIGGNALSIDVVTVSDPRFVVVGSELRTAATAIKGAVPITISAPQYADRSVVVVSLITVLEIDDGILLEIDDNMLLEVV